MNKQASILFSFIDSSSSGSSLALQADSAQHSYYQRLIYALLCRSICAREDFQHLGRQLASIAHHAYFLRQIETVDQASQLIFALPISSELKGIARYYQAICAKRKGDFDGARSLLECVMEEAPQQYKARALLTIGATYFDSGEIETALPFYLTAARASRECDPLVMAQSQWEIAVIRSIHGDHKRALDDLENLFPIVRAIAKHYPLLYYSFLNSLAVELGEVGRSQDAKAACEITLASPFAAIYPEFAQTRDELEAKRTSATPSVVAVNTAPSLRPERNPKPARSLTIIYPAREKAFIQTSIAIALAVIAHIEITQSILERVRHSINPRGPPARL